jgi:hypothetical protein
MSIFCVDFFNSNLYKFELTKLKDIIRIIVSHYLLGNLVFKLDLFYFSSIFIIAIVQKYISCNLFDQLKYIYVFGKNVFIVNMNN